MQYKEVESAAMWKRTSKNGQVYLSVVVEINKEKYSFPLFKNEHKQKENQPDYSYTPKKEEERVQFQDPKDKQLKF